MKAFRYERAGDPALAVAAVSVSPRGRYLGGGTNLFDLMKLGVENPDLLVDVSRLPLDWIEDGAGALRIGAAVRNSDLAAHPAARRRFPAVPEALLSGASGQLRNAATVAGNLLQRTRCRYFQDTGTACNKRRPASGCPAQAGGVHRELAILGTSPHCIATHPSDLAVPLVAFDAVVHLLGPEGPRSMPLEDMYRLPGDRPQDDTVLRPGDLVTAVELPALRCAARSVYRKARDRASYSFALASAAAALDVGGGVVREVRLAFGSVAAKPWRARTAEDALRGAPATEEAFTRAVDAELAAARPLPGNRFKVELTRNLAVRALADLAQLDAP